MGELAVVARRHGPSMSVVHPLGTMPFGDTVDEATATAIVNTAVEGGVRELDTA